jgi:hypothetical protein
MKSTRFSTVALFAIVSAFHFAACLDLTTPWSGNTDAARDLGNTVGAGGTIAFERDDGSVGWGGRAGTGGMATGGVVAGGRTGSAQDDAGFAIDQAASVDASKSGTGDTGEILAADTAILPDASVPQDIAIDVPIFADASAPVDLSAESYNNREAGTLDGAGTGASDSSVGVDADGAPLSQILSIDFVGGMPNGSVAPWGTVVMAANETAGVKPAAHWNSATGSTGSLSSLVLASGAATTASASWSLTPIDGAIDTWSNSFVDATGDTRMMNGYLDPRSSTLPATISVAGLPDPMNRGYDVYVYCYSNMDSPDTRVYEYTIGQTTYSVTQTGPSTSTFPGYVQASGADGGNGGAGNYVVFRHVTGASFSLTAQPETSTFGMQRAPVNGMQIVYPSEY